MLNLRKINGEDVLIKYQELVQNRKSAGVQKVLYYDNAGVCRAWEDFQTGVVYDHRNSTLSSKPPDARAYVV